MSDSKLLPPIPYLCILDFEATCDTEKSWKHEIIEFPSVLLKWDDQLHPPAYREISRFQEYVKPLYKPIVTQFCLELTGITQAQVDNGSNLIDTYYRHFQWLQEQIPNFPDIIYRYPKTPPVVLVTCGNWDMFTMFPPDCIRWGLNPDQFYKQVINLKDCFNTHHLLDKGMGMANMLKFLNLELEGRHHSGIDDCHNIARIAQHLQQDGFVWNWSYLKHVPADSFKRKGKKAIRNTKRDKEARQLRWYESNNKK